MMPDDRTLMVALVGGVLALIGWTWWSNQQDQDERAGAGYTRRVSDSGIYGAALDGTLGQLTPDHLVWFGPRMRPPHWCPHRVRYPTTPGYELERLTYGAPGSYNVVTPPSERGWLFAPPSEVDY